MPPYLTLFLAGMAFGVVLTPLVGRISTRLGLVDAPGARKVHSVAVPRVGGVAVIAAAAGALLMSPAALEELDDLVPILIGGGLVFAIGLVDDMLGLPPWPKLIAQAGASVVVMSSGLLIERITVAGHTWQLESWSWVVTLGWIVLLTNAFNLIDGLDGLAAGIGVIAGATCAAILVARGHSPEATLLSAVVGASLGFLVYNFAPASIFLGDGGSLFIGFLLATTAITGWQKGATALATGVPLLLFALPLTDVAMALARRARRAGRGGSLSVMSVVARVFEPDREHIHHRLVALGFSTRRTVVLLYLVTTLFSALALATAQLN